MQDKSNDISLKQWFTEHKNELEANVLEVLGNKAAQHPLFPCCSGLFIRGEIGLARNQMQPIDELLKDMEAVASSLATVSWAFYAGGYPITLSTNNPHD